MSTASKNFAHFHERKQKIFHTSTTAKISQLFINSHKNFFTRQEPQKIFYISVYFNHYDIIYSEIYIIRG